MGILDIFKKKGLSSKSANFARLIKNFCFDSGIPIQVQLNVTKAIARDYIDNKKIGINAFIFMDHAGAKNYLLRNGMNEMDAEIFLNIIQTNRESFLAI